MVPVAIISQQYCIIADVVVVSLGYYSPICVPEDVVMNASIPPGVCTSKRAIHPYAVLGNVMYPVVCNSCTLLFSLHHLDDSAIGLKVGRVVYLVEHYLGRVSYPNSGRGPSLVHCVVGEYIGRTIHHNCSHQTFLIRSRPVDMVEVGVVYCVVL